MIWINIFFFTVIMNTITGTVAYLLCKLLIRIAEMAGAVRVIYPLYRLVLLFYVVPVGWLYIHAKFYFAYGTTVIGDAFYGKPILSKIVFAALVIWIIGLIGLLIHTVKEDWEK